MTMTFCWGNSSAPYHKVLILHFMHVSLFDPSVSQPPGHVTLLRTSTTSTPSPLPPGKTTTMSSSSFRGQPYQFTLCPTASGFSLLGESPELLTQHIKSQEASSSASPASSIWPGRCLSQTVLWHFWSTFMLELCVVSGLSLKHASLKTSQSSK